MNMMFTIKRALMEVGWLGVEAGRNFVKYFPGVTDIFNGIGAAIKPIPTLFRSLRDELTSLFQGNINMQQFFDNMQKSFMNLFGGEGGAFSQIESGAKKFFTRISGLIGEGVKYLIVHLTEALKKGTEFLKDPEKFLADGASGGSAGMKFILQILQPLIDAVNDPAMWNGLWNAFKGFAGQFWDLAWEKAIKPLASAIPASVWLGFAAILFGPAVGQALIATAVPMLSKAIFNSFFGSAEKVIAEKAASAAVQKMTGAVLQEGVESGASTAGSAVSKGLWSKLMPFLTTVPSGAAAAGAAAMGVAISAIVAAGYAAWSANAAASDVKRFSTDLSTIQLEAINVSSKRVGVEAKRKVLESIDEHMKFMEQEAKDRKEKWSILGVSIYGLGKDAVEQAFGTAGTRTDDMLAKAKREREDLASQISKLDAETAKKAENSAAKQRILEAMGPVTIDNAAERFKKVSDLAKQMMSKDFDIGAKMKMIQDKLSSVDFTLFKDKAKEDQINQTLATLESIRALMGVITDIGALGTKAKDSLAKSGSLKDTIMGFSTLITDIMTVVTGDKGLKTKLEGLASSMSVVSASANKLIDLPTVFKSISEVGTMLKGMLQGVLSSDQRTQISNTILGLINTINVSAGDMSMMKAVDQTQLTKLDGVKNMFTGFSEVSSSAKNFVKDIANSGIAPALKAIGDLVKAANELDSALADGNINKIDIKAKLSNVAKAVGLGGAATYTVDTGKNIVITVNMTVTMDAASVEKAIIYSSKSIITDRLNFATSNPTQKATDTISPGVEAQFPVKGAAK